ncbi:MAG: NAD(P)H-hydrate dehydratase [Poseidonibacter sp.]|uniref:NAD(P)H-hydrate dehydratase n=1 Tax=Poseidonibacter sp. TaxID=2321188 RepID=UPI00359DCC4B
MQKLFDEVNTLDQRCYEKFALSEDILMEHAANSIALYIQKQYKKKKSIFIVCGAGNNGADGIALARLLYKKYEVSLYLPFGVKSNMAKVQEKRAKALGLNFVNEIISSDIIVDCLFGTGLNKDLNTQSINIIKQLNQLESVKIACDIPSGINILGQISTIAFYADITITMGALKTSLYTDTSKDYVGKVLVSNLGVQREVYETTTNKYLLEKSDMLLPFRNTHNSHKGTYGHLNVIAGCKKGASIIASNAAFAFGAGLVTTVSHEELELPCHIMQSHFLSKNCTAIAIGMGLGNYEENEIKDILSKDIPKIIDADLFYSPLILDVLDQNIVLTPHPKEFCALLKLCDIDDISIEQLQNNRLKYVEIFCKKYPNIVLLLKGTNVIISLYNKIYINTYGSASLSKGGSGDVLSGLIGSLLAQGYNALDATISASLAHSIAANNYKKNNYSLSPIDLIEEIKKL